MRLDATRHTARHSRIMASEQQPRVHAGEGLTERPGTSEPLRRPLAGEGIQSGYKQAAAYSKDPFLSDRRSPLDQTKELARIDHTRTKRPGAEVAKWLVGRNPPQQKPAPPSTDCQQSAHIEDQTRLPPAGRQHDADRRAPALEGARRERTCGGIRRTDVAAIVVEKRGRFHEAASYAAGAPRFSASCAAFRAEAARRRESSL